MDMDAVGRKSGPHLYSYDFKDVILYALSVGAKADELDYLLELRGPKVLPTFAVMPALHPTLDVLLDGLKLPNGVKGLHGEQKIVLNGPIDPSGTLTSVAEVVSVQDKAKGTLIYVEVTTHDQNGREVFRSMGSTFCVGLTGFGVGGQANLVALSPTPETKPDFEIKEATSQEQALIYRLGGDYNPLHADPEIAARHGYAKPILQGLCTFGYAGRAILKALCGGDAARLRSFEARFSKPVIPGDVLTTQGWELEPRRYAIRTINQDGQQTLANGLCELD